MKTKRNVRPDEQAQELLQVSIAELKHVSAQLADRANLKVNRLLLPTNKQGLYNAMLAYRALLTMRPFVAPMNREIKQQIDDYANEWQFLFEAILSLDKMLHDLVKDARNAQKNVHRTFKSILGDGNDCNPNEYDKFSDALTALSEQMGENAESAAKRSRKGCKRDELYTAAAIASSWTGVSVPTLYRQWKKPTKGRIRPPFNIPGSEEARKCVWKEWARQNYAKKYAAHEANMMNHAIPLASVGVKAKVRNGV